MGRQFSIILFSFLGIGQICFAQNIQHDFFSNKVHLLLPTDFAQAIPHYNDGPKPDVYFIQKDTIVEFTMIKIPKRTDDLKKYQQMMQGAFLSNATKTYKNDIEIINGKPVAVAEFESVFVGKPSYNIVFAFNVDEFMIMSNYSVSLPYRDKWKELGDTILHSLKY